MKSLSLIFLITMQFSYQYLYAVKPYSEQASNFSATISVTVNPGSNFTEYKYEISYSQNNPRDLAILQFYFPPQVLESEFLMP